MFFRLLDHLMGKCLDIWGGRPPKCSVCKAGMEKKENPRLFLIPVLHDGDYTASAAYYQKNCTPVWDVKDIPIGFRCYML